MTIIETASVYKVGDKLFSTFESAQVDALTGMFNSIAADSSTKTLAEHLLAKKDEVLAILSMSEPVKRGRKPRSDQGKPHAKKKAKAPEEPASPGIKVEPSGKYES